MQIKIYNYTYTIEFKTNDEIKKSLDKNTDDTYIGVCKSSKQVILLSSEMHKEKIIPVLIHEITHAILNDKGYNMKSFDEEDLCCFMEANFAEIQRAVGEFLDNQGQNPIR